MGFSGPKPAEKGSIMRTTIARVLGTLRALVRLAFWRIAFWIEKKRRGVTYFHATLAPCADTKTASGRADLYRSFTRMMRHMDKTTPIPQSEIEELFKPNNG
jgi:hypothetical protein